MSRFQAQITAILDEELSVRIDLTDAEASSGVPVGEPVGFEDIPNPRGEWMIDG